MDGEIHIHTRREIENEKEHHYINKENIYLLKKVFYSFYLRHYITFSTSQLYCSDIR